MVSRKQSTFFKIKKKIEIDSLYYTRHGRFSCKAGFRVENKKKNRVIRRHIIYHVVNKPFIEFNCLQYSIRN